MSKADRDGGGGGTGPSGNSGGGGGTGGGRSRGSRGGYVDNDAQRADVERESTAASQSDSQASENSGQSAGRPGGGDSAAPGGADQAGGTEGRAPGSPASEQRGAPQQSMNEAGAIAGEQESEDDAERGFLDSFRSFVGIEAEEDESPDYDAMFKDIKEMDPTLTSKELTTIANEAGIPQAINEQQESDTWGTIAKAAGTVFGGIPGAVAGLAVDTAMRAQNASAEIDRLNEKFGMNMDASFGASMHSQTVGALADKTVGTVVGKAVGGLATKAAGPAGGLVGGLISSNMGEQARSKAMTGKPSASAPGNASGPRNSTGGGTSQTGIATAQPPAQTSPSVRKAFGPALDYDYGIDTSQGFNAYGSYATQFFG